MTPEELAKLNTDKKICRDFIYSLREDIQFMDMLNYDIFPYTSLYAKKFKTN